MAKKKSEQPKSPAAQARQQGLTYVAQDGSHLSGVPATDISPDEVGQLTIKQIEAALASGLYTLGGEK